MFTICCCVLTIGAGFDFALLSMAVCDGAVVVAVVTDDESALAAVAAAAAAICAFDSFVAFLFSRCALGFFDFVPFG